MIKIVNKPGGDGNRTVVQMGVEDLLQRPYYLPGEDKPHPSGEIIGDAIRRVAWQALMRKAPHLKGDNFKYGEVEVGDEGVLVTFYREMPLVPDEPGGK